MNTLIIYDNTGYVISQMAGSVREPQGIPFLWVEIPEAKQLKRTDGIGVDVSVTPHQAILEDIPPTKIEILETELINNKLAMAELVEQQQADNLNNQLALAEVIESIMGGGTVA
jgi:hypothetical protein